MDKRKIITRIWKFLRHYRGLIVLSLLLALGTVAIQLYIPILTGRAVDTITGTGHVNFGGKEGLISYLLKIVTAAFGAAALQWIMNAINNRITYRTVHDIRRDAFEKIQHLPVSYTDSHSQGDIVSRIIADVDQFADGLLMGFTQFFTGVASILGTLAFMLSINWVIALVVVCITPLSLFVAASISRRTYHMFHRQSEVRGDQTGLINEMISHQDVVQAYTREDEVLHRFDEVNEKLNRYSMKALFYSSLTNPSTRFVNNVVYAGVALTGGLSAIAGRLTVGGLTAFLSYANQYTKPFNEISGVVTELQNALACADRIFEFLDAPEEKPDRTDAPEFRTDQSIELKDVSFSYVPERKLIKDFNLRVSPGMNVAIVGPTGCGKTTMINLLERFYDIDSGSIVMGNAADGTRPRTCDITRHQLRKSFGMVLQDTWLFKGTVYENIAFARPDATREEVVEAAKKARADSFIRRLPQKYDTLIGEDGSGLSEGQKQLLCIARVMLDLPPMLILDEATSSIDTMTEMKIQKAFDEMMEGRTSFVVAHRLSTIVNADIILVMRDGNVVEQGNHAELLAENGFYRELYESQFASTRE